MKIVTRMSPSTTTNVPVESIGSQFVMQRRRDLEEQEREADRDAEGEEELAARELGLDLAVLALLLGGVVRRDGERAKADRERLPERDDAADDRQPQPAVAQEHRRDRPVDLGDVAVRLSHGDGPGRRATHHHALEDRLASDRGAHGASFRC